MKLFCVIETPWPLLPVLSCLDGDVSDVALMTMLFDGEGLFTINQMPFCRSHSRNSCSEVESRRMYRWYALARQMRFDLAFQSA
ncbi:hypothetical protein DPMN_170505 [Dreissena polymorpha]|uniref:Uncharacterized protein n=1 Tax=Dreissena polymorpha TaxID=45954 RepID=A0A9D4DYQ6_DREPO|nr:hypothetical protein DPMN_170505 [Dreissena polymorpha]